MRLYLDDVRPVPPGWTHCRWPTDMIALLEVHTNQVEAISLDNDLGEQGACARIGRHVVDWLDEVVTTEGCVPPRFIRLHTSNTTERSRMAQAIERLCERNGIAWHCRREEPLTSGESGLIQVYELGV